MKHQHPISKHQTTVKFQTPGCVVNSACGPGGWWLKFVWCLEIGFWCLSPGQNVIEDRATGLTAPVIQITESQALALVSFPFQSSTNRRSSELERIARKLDRHVSEFIGGWPWRPFHHTLGISGYEACFNHPDEIFFALSLALPVLSSNTAAKAKVFLVQRLAELPPYS